MNYNALTLKHFFHPLGQDLLTTDLASVNVCLGSVAMGQMVDMTLCYEKDMVAGLYFKAYGSPYLIASLSLMVEMVQQMSLSRAKNLDEQVFIEKLAMPHTKYHHVFFAIDVLKQAISHWEKSDDRCADQKK